ncbi:hypothetical protein BGZ54_010037 [Gamsiella multidivaricata]|nr:hypothetical protein BGZ54_010037 [Gamsiella multidivaricata]
MSSEDQEQFQKVCQAHYRTIANADSAVSLTDETAFADSLITDSPSVSPSLERSNTMASALQHLVGNNSVHGGSGSNKTPTVGIPVEAAPSPFQHHQFQITKSRSGSVSSGHYVEIGRTSNASQDVPVPSLPTHLRKQQQQQLSQSPASSVVVSVQNNVASPTTSIGGGKAGWEREDTTPTTPTSQGNRKGPASETQTPQTSSSLFDFLRNRRSSISRNNPQLQQVAKAASSVIAAGAISAVATMTAGNPGTGSNNHGAMMMGTPPSIAKSRMNTPSPLGPPIPPPSRKQSLDVSAFRANQQIMDPSMQKDDRQTPAMPVLPTSYATNANDTSLSESTLDSSTQNEQGPRERVQQIQYYSITSAAQLTFSKVAAAVVGATVGKRRPSVPSELEAGIGYGTNKGRSLGGMRRQSISSYKSSLGEQWSLSGSGATRFGQQALDQQQLNNHMQFMKSEVRADELAFLKVVVVLCVRRFNI